MRNRTYIFSWPTSLCQQILNLSTLPPVYLTWPPFFFFIPFVCVWLYLVYARVQRFLQLGSPRQNFIHRHLCQTVFSSFFEPFRPRLISKFGKSAIWFKKFVWHKCKMGIEKRWILCWFRVRWKICKKSYKKLSQKNRVFDFYYCVLCSAYIFLGEFFCIFNGFKLSINFFVLWYK